MFVAHCKKWRGELRGLVELVQRMSSSRSVSRTHYRPTTWSRQVAEVVSLR